MPYVLYDSSYDFDIGEMVPTVYGIVSKEEVASRLCKMFDWQSKEVAIDDASLISITDNGQRRYGVTLSKNESGWRVGPPLPLRYGEHQPGFIKKTDHPDKRLWSSHYYVVATSAKEALELVMRDIERQAKEQMTVKLCCGFCGSDDLEVTTQGSITGSDPNTYRCNQCGKTGEVSGVSSPD